MNPDYDFRRPVTFRVLADSFIFQENPPYRVLMRILKKINLEYFQISTDDGKRKYSPNSRLY